MEMSELEQIEREERVPFVLNDQRRLEMTGTDQAITRALARIGNRRDELVALLRQRQGLPDHDEEPIVKRTIPIGVPSVEVQKQNYVTWFMARPKIFQPKPDELDRMFAAVEAGDEVIFDFALSITVRRSSGLIVAIDRKGRIAEPSPYSPAVRGK
jgi:hypothetical protein